MPYIRIRKDVLRKILILILLLLCTLGIFGGLYIWDQQQIIQTANVYDNEYSSDNSVEDKQSSYVLKNGLETYLVIGIDKRGALEPSQSYNNDKQADFLLLTIIDNENKTVEILHINRDTITEVPVLGVNGEPAGTVTEQIALSYTYGSGMHDSSKNTVEAVSMLLQGVKIDHYITMTMDAVPIINDMAGGVTVKVLDDFSGIDDSLEKDKEVTLKGEQALTYIRSRSGLEDSTNINRMRRQKQYLEALSEQMKSLDKDYLPSMEEIEKISYCILSDQNLNELFDVADQISDYEFLGIYDIAGEAKQGEKYMEFYCDYSALSMQIFELFYEKS